MQLLAENLERQVAAQVRKGLVVWLDKDGLYTEFVDQLAERRAQGLFSAPVLAHRGSFLELLIQLENCQEGLDSEPLLLHVPGYTDATIRSTPLLEAYRAGTRFERALPTLVREVATGHVPAAEVERFLSQEQPGLSRAEEWLQHFLDQERTGLAATLTHWKPEAVLCALLAGSWAPEVGDEEVPVLQDYIERHCGLSPAYLRAHLGEIPARKCRALVEAWVGWLLCVEYVSDLSRKPTDPLLSPLTQLSAPLRKTCLGIVEAVRRQHPGQYRQLANQTEILIEADLRSGRPEELGRIDTFSREDSRLLEAAVEALHQEDWKQALEWAETRLKTPSVWLEAEPLRCQEWQLVKASAQLGQRIQHRSAPLQGAQSLAEALERYTGGVHQVDQAHRWFEQDRVRLLEPRLIHFEALAQATRHLRKLYHRWVDILNRQFTDLCVQHGFLPESSLQQRTLYEQVVHPLTQRHSTVAYFLVDGLRYEMAAELAHRLEKAGLTLHLKARLAELPSITRVGMNVLAPVSREGHLKVDGSFAGFRAGEYVVKTPEQRLRAMGERSLDSLPGGRRSPLGLTLSDIHNESPQTLKKKIARSPLVVVHSREIDSSGESDLGIATFETWLGQLYSAVQLLHNAGVDQFVITADHGFLLIDESREPLNLQGERRFVLSDAKITQDSTASVSTHSLAYEGGPGYILFPRDASTFRSQGSVAQTFVHGGNSLQERAIPVLSLSYRTRELVGLGQYILEAEAQPPLLGHCRLRVRLREGESMMLGFENKTVAVALRVVDPQGQGTRVSCKQVNGATLQHQQLLLTVGADWAEVIFTLEGGSASRAALELYHPDGQENLAPKRLAEYFDVNLTSPASNPPASSEGSWEEAIEDQGHRKVFLHLAQYDSIDEEEITKLLGDARATRKFARKFETYLCLLPFQIGIDSQGPLKRYLKKG
ncbi:BREX-6 system phosphatase PglZ [bacterium]|nr:BREX-6 system phosphatase PglZ [bacterium]